MKFMIKYTLAALSFTALTASAAEFPLRVEIDASASTEQLNIGAGAEGEASVERVIVNVKIRKSSSQAWKKKVKAELYVIGVPKSIDGFTVVSSTSTNFTFTTENDNTFTFESPVYSFGETSGNINVGLVYETYLVVVTDEQGKIVDTRSGRKLDKKEIELIRKLDLNKIYNKELQVIGTVSDLKKATKAAATSATDPGDTY